jgi:hypothetical protein
MLLVSIDSILKFELSLIVPWQISINAAGCEYRTGIKGKWQTWSMLLLFVSILNIFVYTCGTLSIRILDCHRLSISDQFQGANTTSHSDTRIRASRSCTGMGFNCIICNTEFATRRGADCHCRHPACSGTASADPSNM